MEVRTQFGDDDVSGTLLGRSVTATLNDDDASYQISASAGLRIAF